MPTCQASWLKETKMRATTWVLVAMECCLLPCGSHDSSLYLSSCLGKSQGGCIAALGGLLWPTTEITKSSLSSWCLVCRPLPHWLQLTRWCSMSDLPKCSQKCKSCRSVMDMYPSRYQWDRKPVCIWIKNNLAERTINYSWRCQVHSQKDERRKLQSYGFLWGTAISLRDGRPRARAGLSKYISGLCRKIFRAVSQNSELKVDSSSLCFS